MKVELNFFYSLYIKKNFFINIPSMIILKMTPNFMIIFFSQKFSLEGINLSRVLNSTMKNSPFFTRLVESAASEFILKIHVGKTYVS